MLAACAMLDDDGGDDAGAMYLLHLANDGRVAASAKISAAHGGLAEIGFAPDDGSQWCSSVASAGDMDGDGIEELLVGARAKNYVDVVFIAEDGASVRAAVRLAGVAGNPLPAAAYPDGAVDQWGGGVSSVPQPGGPPRIIVAATVADLGGLENSGAIYILQLKSPPTPPAVALATALIELSAATEGSSDNDWAALGTAAASDLTGSGVAALSDVDGDDLPDLCIGQPGHQAEGAVLVLRRLPDGSARLLQRISSSSGLADGLSIALDSNGNFGVSVAGLKNADSPDDGVPSLLVGAHYAVWIIRLDASGEAVAATKITNSDLDGTSQDSFGIGVATVPNLDSDPREELAVGRHQDSDGGTGRGAVYIIFVNSADDSLRTYKKISQTSNAGWAPIAGSDSQEFGWDVTAFLGPAGESVLAVSAHLDDDGGQVNTGAVYLLSMSEAGDGRVASTAKLSAAHGALGNAGLVLSKDDGWGTCVGVVPDLDDDSIPELLVSSSGGLFVDLCFLDESLASVRSGVRLSSQSTSALTPAARSHIKTGIEWGRAVAGLPPLTPGNYPWLAISAATAGPPSSSGAVFVVQFDAVGGVGGHVLHVPSTADGGGGHDPASAATAVVTLDPDTASSPGVAVLARACFPGCAGDCQGGSLPTSCDDVLTVGCATGYKVSSDGSAACCPEAEGDSARPVYHRSLPRDPPVSCLHALQRDPTARSGVYTIRPDMHGNAIRVWCDMERDGGGWSLLMVYSKDQTPLPTPFDYPDVSDVTDPTGAETFIYQGSLALFSDVREEVSSGQATVWGTNKTLADLETIRNMYGFESRLDIAVEDVPDCRAEFVSSGAADDIAECCGAYCYFVEPIIVGWSRNLPQHTTSELSCWAGTTHGNQLRGSGRCPGWPDGTRLTRVYFRERVGTRYSDTGVSSVDEWECGVCHSTCSACDGPGAGSCLPGSCAPGFWWTGARCLPVSPPCDDTREHVVAGKAQPTASSDRVCGTCHECCVAGCSGGAVGDCTSTLLASGGARTPVLTYAPPRTADRFFSQLPPPASGDPSWPENLALAATLSGVSEVTSVDGAGRVSRTTLVAPTRVRVNPETTVCSQVAGSEGAGIVTVGDDRIEFSNAPGDHGAVMRCDITIPSAAVRVRASVVLDGHDPTTGGATGPDYDIDPSAWGEVPDGGSGWVAFGPADQAPLRYPSSHPGFNFAVGDTYVVDWETHAGPDEFSVLRFEWAQDDASENGILRGFDITVGPDGGTPLEPRLRRSRINVTPENTACSLVTGGEYLDSSVSFTVLSDQIKYTILGNFADDPPVMRCEIALGKTAHSLDMSFVVDGTEPATHPDWSWRPTALAEIPNAEYEGYFSIGTPAGVIPFPHTLPGRDYVAGDRRTADWGASGRLPMFDVIYVEISQGEPNEAATLTDFDIEVIEESFESQELGSVSVAAGDPIDELSVTVTAANTKCSRIIGRDAVTTTIGTNSISHRVVTQGIPGTLVRCDVSLPEARVHYTGLSVSFSVVATNPVTGISTHPDWQFPATEWGRFPSGFRVDNQAGYWSAGTPENGPLHYDGAIGTNYVTGGNSRLTDWGDHDDLIPFKTVRFEFVQDKTDEAFTLEQIDIRVRGHAVECAAATVSHGAALVTCGAEIRLFNATHATTVSAGISGATALAALALGDDLYYFALVPSEGIVRRARVLPAATNEPAVVGLDSTSAGLAIDVGRRRLFGYSAMGVWSTSAEVSGAPLTPTLLAPSADVGLSVESLAALPGSDTGTSIIFVLGYTSEDQQTSTTLRIDVLQQSVSAPSSIDVDPAASRVSATARVCSGSSDGGTVGVAAGVPDSGRGVAWTGSGDDPQSHMAFVSACCGSESALLPAADLSSTALADAGASILGTGSGAAWVDVDLNGLNDLLVVNLRGSNALLVQEQPRSFVDEGEERGFGALGPAHAVATGDCDGDRDPDVLVAHAAGWDNLLLLNDGTGRFVDAPRGHGAELPEVDTASVLWFDVDDDGTLDLIMTPMLTIAGHGPQLLINEGSCRFVDNTVDSGMGGAGALLGVDTIISSSVALDYNADAHLDVLVIPASGSAVLLSYQPTLQSFAASDVTASNDGVGHNVGAAVADVTGDGAPDVLLATTRGVRVLAADLAADITDSILPSQDPGVVMVASAAPTDIGIGVGVFSIVDDVGGRLYSPDSHADANGVGVLSVRILHRLSDAAGGMPGVLVSIHAAGHLAPIRAAIAVDGGGGHVQSSAAAVSFSGLAVGVSRGYDIMARIPTRDGTFVKQVTNLTLSTDVPVRLVNFSDAILRPALSVSPSTGCVTIGQTLKLHVVARGAETGFALSSRTMLNHYNNSDGQLSSRWTDFGNGTYELTHSVTEGDADWARGALPLSLMLLDEQLNVPSDAFEWRHGDPAPCADANRPTALFDSVPPLLTRENTATLRLTCTELLCSYRYSLNGGAWQAVEGGADAGAEVDGAGLSVSVDNLPKKRTASQTVNAVVHVDGATVQDGEAGPVVQFRLMDEATAVAVEEADSDDSDETVGVEIAAWGDAAAGNRISASDLADGTYLLEARAGAADPSPLRYSFTVDTEPPSVEIISGPSVSHTQREAELTYESPELGCTFRYRLSVIVDDASAVGVWVNTTHGHAVLGPDQIIDGANYVFEVVAVDGAGNQGPATSHTWSVETCSSVPDVTIERTQSADAGLARVVWIASDAEVVEYRTGAAGQFSDWQLSTERKFVLTAGDLNGDASRHFEVRAYVTCVPHTTGRPTPTTFEWRAPAPIPVLVPSIVVAPLEVTTIAVARFRFSLETDALRGPTPQLEVAYGYSPQYSDGSDAAVEFHFPGGSDDGELPVWRPAQLKHTVGPVALGTHRLLVRAVDAATGEVDPRAPNGGVVSHTWSLRSADASVVNVPGLDSGLHTVRISATDAAGNPQAEGSEQSHQWEVDTQPPETDASLVSPEINNASAVLVEASCLGESTPLACKFCWSATSVPTGCAAATPSPFGIPVPAGAAYERPHSVVVFAYDGAGNKDPVGIPVAWTTDRVPPLVTPSLLSHSRWLPSLGAFATNVSSPTIQAVGNEPLAAVGVHGEWHNNVDEDSSAEAVVSGPLPDGGIVIVAVGRDLAGNFGPPSDLPLFIDTTAPEASVVTPLPVLYNGTTLQFQVDGGDSADPLFAFHTRVAGPSIVKLAPVLTAFGAAGVAASTVVHLSGLQDGNTYEVRAAAEDVAGNVGAAVPVGVVTIDTQPPESSASLLSPSLTNGTSVRVAVSCVNDPRPEGCTFCFAPPPLLGAIDCVSSVSSVSIAVPEGDGVDGTYSVDVTATDAAGNDALVPATVTFTLDRTPPGLTLALSHATRARLLGPVWMVGTASPVVVVSGDEPLGWASVEGFDESSANAGSGTRDIRVQLDGLHNGLAALRGLAADVAGNVAADAATLDVEIDLVAPELELTMPPPRLVNSTSVTMTLSGVHGSSDPLFAFHVTMSPVGGEAEAHNAVVEAAYGAMGEAASADVSFGGLLHGVTYDVLAAAEDVAGNIAEARSVALVTVDLVAPNGVVTAEPPRTFGSRTLTFVVASNESSCELRIAGELQGGSERVSAVGRAMSGDDPLDVVGDLVVGLDGSYEISMVIVDGAGNYGNAFTRVVTVDTVAPSLELVAPFSTGTYTAQPYIEAQVTCDDASECTVAVHGADVEPWTGTLASQQAVQLPLQALQPGHRTATITVVDAAENVGATSAFDWHFDVTQPSMQAWVWHDPHDSGVDEETASWRSDVHHGDAVLDVADDDVPVTDSNALTFRVQCDDPDGSDCTLKARVNLIAAARVACGESGGSAQSPMSVWTPVGDGGTADVALVGLADGQWQLQLEGTDEAKHVQNASAYRWHVDTRAPSPPTIVAKPDIVEDTGVATESFQSFELSLDDVSPFLGRSFVSFTLDQPLPVYNVSLSAVDEQAGTIGATIVVGTSDSPVSLPLDDGDHSLTAWVTDFAGNRGGEATKLWSVQSARPVAVVLRKPADEVGPDRVTVEFAGLSAELIPLRQPGFEVSMGDGTWLSVCEEGAPGTRVADNRCSYEVVAPDLRTYVIQVRVSNGFAPSDGVSVSWTRKNCVGQLYAIINTTNGAVECKECPVGADCAADLIQKEDVQAQPGFWHGGGFDFYECYLDSCEGARPGPNGTMLPSGCKTGYTGRLCSLCADGYFMQFRRCRRCPETQGGSVGLLLGIAVVLVLAGGVAFKLRNVMPMAIGKIVVSFLQVVGSANVAFRISWPPAFEESIDAMKVRVNLRSTSATLLVWVL